MAAQDLTPPKVDVVFQDLTPRRAAAGVWAGLLAMCWVTTVLAAPAQRIVTLAPSLTELTFAAGAGDRLTATVEYSDLPEAARKIPRIGDAFRVDMEKLLSLHPDLVLGWEGGTPAALLQRVAELGLRVEVIATYRLVDISAAVRKIGVLAGTSGVAEAKARQIESEIGSLVETYSARSPIAVFIEVDDQPLYTVNHRQIISQVVELCGGRNIFGDLPQLAPAIGMEAVIARNPEVILSTDDTVEDAEGDWSRWPDVMAVRAGNIFTMSANDIAQPTTRIIAGARAVCAVLDRARANLAELAFSRGKIAPANLPGK